MVLILNCINLSNWSAAAPKKRGTLLAILFCNFPPPLMKVRQAVRL